MKPNTLALALSAAFTASSHANVLDIKSVSGPEGDVESHANFLINSKGLNSPVSPGMTKSEALAVNHELSELGHLSSWTSSMSTTLTPAVFIFDLGKDQTLTSAILWQYANHEDYPDSEKTNSARNFEFIFHTQAEGPKIDFSKEKVEYKGTLAQLRGTGAKNNPAQLFHLPSQSARYVALRLVDNYGGNRLGLGEIRFLSEIAPKQVVQKVTPARENSIASTTLFAVGGVSFRLNSSD